MSGIQAFFYAPIPALFYLPQACAHIRFLLAVIPQRILSFPIQFFALDFYCIFSPRIDLDLDCTLG